MTRKTIRADGVHKRWMKNPHYKAAYDELADEFAWASALIDVRTHAGLTQEEIAERMGTTQQVISRLESGRVKPSTRTLERYAQATGTKLMIGFAPPT
jgi:DNA-binding XRE family transcriptional regulator